MFRTDDSMSRCPILVDVLLKVNPVQSASAASRR